MELLDVYDENNNYLGHSLPRKEIHEKKLWHRHVSAWIMNKEGKILLQQRSFNKNKNPGKWSKTGGHVDAGETCEQAIKREIYEEIGLKINNDEINNIEVFKSKTSKENYYSYGYIFITDLKENEFKLQKEEVNAVKYFDIEELEQLKKQKNDNYTFCNWDEEGFKKQMELLKKYRNRITYKLIKSKKQDIEKLIEYKTRTIYEYAENLSNEEIEKINNYVSNNIPKIINNYYNIIVNKDIAGCLLLTNNEDGKLLDEIYLEEQYRNQGIGTNIIKNILKQNDTVYLWVYKKNKKAIKLYKKLGFNIIEETESRYYMKYKKENS